MAMAMARSLARAARPVGPYRASDVLRLSAAKVDDPDDRAALELAADLRELEDEQHMSAGDPELARLTREYPREMGVDPRIIPRDSRQATPEACRADREAGRVLADHVFPKVGKKQKTGKVGTRTRAHEEPEREASTDPHKEIQRYLAWVQSTFSPDKPHGAHHSYGPRDYRSPGPEGKLQHGSR